MSTHREIEEVYLSDIIKIQKMTNSTTNTPLGEMQGRKKKKRKKKNKVVTSIYTPPKECEECEWLKHDLTCDAPEDFKCEL